MLLTFVCVTLSARSNLTRERTLVITRHGIRVPFPPFDGHSISIFSKDRTRPWVVNPKDWGADKVAALTDHGKEVVRLMGAHFAETVLPPRPYSFTIYSDLDHTRRDIQTAEAFMRGAWPEKNFTVDPWDRAHPSYIALLFNQGNASNSPCSMSGTLPDVVKAEIGGSFERVSAEQADNIMRLNDAIDCCTPDVCRLAAETAMGGAGISATHAPSANCTLMDIASYWEGRSHYWEDFRGPLSVASNLIEYLQLMDLNGLDWQAVASGRRDARNGDGSGSGGRRDGSGSGGSGGGRVGTASGGAMSAQELRGLMRMHERVMGIADDYWNAQHAGSELLVHMAATMLQMVEPAAPLPTLRSSPSDRLVYYSGHDINVYLLRRLLNLNWLTDSFNPNESPPGGFISLELYSLDSALSSSPDATESEEKRQKKEAAQEVRPAHTRVPSPEQQRQYFVKAFFTSQSYEQQRHATPLSAANPASRVFAVIPACASGPELSCPFDDFRRLVLSVVNTDCVRLVDPNILRRVTTAKR